MKFRLKVILRKPFRASPLMHAVVFTYPASRPEMPAIGYA